MRHLPRRHLQGEAGFTLIELLTVILIIGILAAIAIPSFLSQKSNAYDASAKELARTAQTTAENIATDKNGEYEKVTVAELKNYEPSIQTTAGKGEAYISKATKAANEYSVTATANVTGDEFTISRSSAGVISRKCKSATTGCAGGKESSW